MNLTSYQQGMTWYHLLIYFVLFANAGACIMNAIGFLYIFMQSDSLQILYVLLVLAYLIMTVFTLATRHSLAKKREKAPELLSALFSCNAYATVASGLVLLLAAPVPFHNPTMIAFLIFAFTNWNVLKALNNKYFKKRRSLFVN